MPHNLHRDGSCKHRRWLVAAVTLLLFGATEAGAEVYVVGRLSDNIVVFDDNGAFLQSFSLPFGSGEASDIAQAPNGEIWVLRSGGTVHRYSSGLGLIATWSPPFSPAYGINVDASGLIYIAGSGSTSVHVYDAAAVLQSTLTPSGGSDLRDTVQVGSDTWISNFIGAKIDIMDAGGSDIGDISTPSAPFGMQKAPNGDVWLVDQTSHLVRRITPAGTTVLSFDADDGPNGPIGGQLRYLGVAPDGTLFIPRRGETRVDAYTNTGEYRATLAHASLNGPEGIIATGIFNDCSLGAPSPKPCELPTDCIDIELVTVGDPGNVCETQNQRCLGAVAYEYLIGKYEVTNAQYTVFLNAVAATDAESLYHTNMDPAHSGGIARSGSPGSYTYSAQLGREEWPVNYVSFYDATRFANWLHNGQPAGVQDDTTTEDGAYTLSPLCIAFGLARNERAQVFVPSEDEWYKAAYYDSDSGVYFYYPAGSETPTECTVPGATANTANCDSVFGVIADVGSYSGAASPYGTFDQGGNLQEWNDAIYSPLADRVIRGGNFLLSGDELASTSRAGAFKGASERFLGFRVASAVPGLPVPEVPSLSPLAIIALLGLLGAVAHQRLRANERLSKSCRKSSDKIL